MVEAARASAESALSLSSLIATEAPGEPATHGTGSFAAALARLVCSEDCVQLPKDKPVLVAFNACPLLPELVICPTDPDGLEFESESKSTLNE